MLLVHIGAPFEMSKGRVPSEGSTVTARVATARKRAQFGRFAEALDVLEDLGEYKTAQKALKKIRRNLVAQLIETLLENARSEIQENRYRQALVSLEEVLEEDSGHQQALELMQTIYLRDPSLTVGLDGGDVPRPKSVTETRTLLDRIESILGPEADELLKGHDVPKSQFNPAPTPVTPLGHAGVEAREPGADSEGFEEAEEAASAELEAEAPEKGAERQATPEAEVGRGDLSHDSIEEPVKVDLPLPSSGGAPEQLEAVRAREVAPEAPETVHQISSSVPARTRISKDPHPRSPDFFKPRKRRTWRIWVGGLVVVVLLGGFVFGVVQIKKEAFRSTRLRTETDKLQVRVPASPPPPQEDRVVASEIPPTVSTTPPEPERLTLLSQPPNARIFLNGKLAGTAPLEVAIPEDQSLEIEVNLEGHRSELGKLSWSQLTKAQRNRRELVFRLQPLVRPGTLVVPAGFPARVFVDGTNRGVISRLNLAPGRYRVRLEAPDVFYKSKPEIVHIHSGETHTLQTPQVVELQIGARPSNCEASVDGIPVGPLPIPRLRIVTGLHRFRFEWPELGRSKTEDIVVRPDKVRIEGILGSR